MAKLLEGGISPFALLAQEEQRQAAQTPWSPHLKEAIDAKARSALELHNQGESRVTTGPLAQLPPELLQALLTFLDYGTNPTKVLAKTPCSCCVLVLEYLCFFFFFCPPDTFYRRVAPVQLTM
jgi:hypothetical protein